MRGINERETMVRYWPCADCGMHVHSSLHGTEEHTEWCDPVTVRKLIELDCPEMTHAVSVFHRPLANECAKGCKAPIVTFTAQVELPNGSKMTCDIAARCGECHELWETDQYGSRVNTI